MNQNQNYSRKMILFDLDGTLWDSSEQVADSWNEVLKKEQERLTGDFSKKSFSSQDIRNVMGKTMEEIALILMPEEQPSVRSEVFHECETYEVSYIEQHGGRLFPDIPEVLGTLLDRGYLLSVVSNCQEGYIRAFLNSMNMDTFFCDYEEWGRTGLSKGENIRLVMQRNKIEQALYAGDTQKDRDAAAQAGIPFIWASYGFGDVTGYDAVITEASQLPGAADEVFHRCFPEN